jgi:pimeloyl-ACP methyl ester carboxylesterase
MAYVRASDGVRLAYSIEGNGPPLVLHLGAGCDAELWRTAGYVDGLRESYRCILFDHRGHGGSDIPRGPERYPLAQMRDDVVTLLDALEIETAGFWGYSAGVGIGLLVAERHPDRLRALVGSGVVGPDTREEIEAWAREETNAFRRDGWEHLIEHFDDQEADPVPDWMKASIRATDVGQWTDQIEALRREFWDVDATLRGVETPTLYVTGSLEDPDDITGRSAGTMPNAKRVRLDGLGHINAFLRSDLVLPIVLPFLAEHLA